MLVGFRLTLVYRSIHSSQMRLTTTNRGLVRGGSGPQWATTIADLRERMGLSQTEFGQQLGVSAMGVSRWECGVQEPPARSYIELGNLAGDPACWYFWARAGLRTEDLMRVIPNLRGRLRKTALPEFEIVNAGSGGAKLTKGKHEVVAIPLLKVVAASYGDKGDTTSILHGVPIESLIAAPKSWCSNPSTTSCLRVRGDSMNPLIYDGYIVAVDSSQNDRAKLNGKIVIAWHKEKGLTVSRLRRYDHTEMLQPDNTKYESVTLQGKNEWRILAKVWWWIGKAP
jgi:SOS-response transcriptional repressor LexA